MSFNSKPPVDPKNKRIINGMTDINQLAPFKYKWAWEYFLNGNKNHWVPSEITMHKDKSDFELKLSDHERHVFTNVLAYLTTSDILALRNIAIAMMERITAPEIQIYMARQVAEECLTEDHYVYTEDKKWVSIKDIKVDDKILTYSRNTNEFEYSPVRYVHVYNNTKGLYHFKGKKFSQITSAFHRILVKKRGEWTFFHAKKLFEESADNYPLSQYDFPLYNIKSNKITYDKDVKVEYLNEVKDTYCVSVKPGIMVIKHNDVVSITGNSIHCYDKDTKVFTDKGFIPFMDITKDTLVGQVTIDGKLEMVRHLGITKDKYTGKMYKIYDKNNRRTIKVTPNHNCVYYDSRDNKYHRIKANKIHTLKNNTNIYLPVTPYNGYIRHKETSDRFYVYATICALYQMYGYNYTNLDNDNLTILQMSIGTDEDKYHKIIEFLQISKKYFQSAINTVNGETNITIGIPRIFDPDNTMSSINALYMEHDIANILLNIIDIDCLLDGSIEKLSTYTLLSIITKNPFYINKTNYGFESYTLDKGLIPIQDIIIDTYDYGDYVYSVGVPSKMLLVLTDNTMAIDGNTWTYQHCIETIGLDQMDVYNRYRTVPEIHSKIIYSSNIINRISNPSLDLTDRDQLMEFLKGYFFFCGIFEGLWFYNGFNPIFSLQRLGLMKGTGEQLQYILRDEALHVSFGLKTINTIFEEENIRIPEEVIYSIIKDAYDLEHDYINYILPKPIGDYSNKIHMEQYKYMANRRLKALGYKPLYPNAKNRAIWLTEQATVRKEKNFFETRVTEYEAGGLEW